MDREAVKEKTRKAYNRVGPDYDNWYWAKAAKKVRADSTRKVINILKSELNDNPKILDLCCGTGHLVKELSAIGDYTGIDFAESMMEYCSATYPENRFVLGDAEKLPFPNDNFDAVVCFWSFHHLLYPGKVLDEIKRVLKPNGFVLIMTFKNVKLNLAAKLGDVVSSAYWGFTTIRYSEKDMQRLIGERFKNIKIEKFPSAFSLLNTMGIRFLIVQGRK